MLLNPLSNLKPFVEDVKVCNTALQPACESFPVTIAASKGVVGMISFVSTHETVMVYTPVVFVSSSNSIQTIRHRQTLVARLDCPGADATNLEVQDAIVRVNFVTVGVNEL